MFPFAVEFILPTGKSEREGAAILPCDLIQTHDFVGAQKLYMNSRNQMVFAANHADREEGKKN